MTDAEQPCKCLEGGGHSCRPSFYDGDDWPVTQPVPGTSIGRVEDWLWPDESPLTVELLPKGQYVEQIVLDGEPDA